MEHYLDRNGREALRAEDVNWRVDKINGKVQDGMYIDVDTKHCQFALPEPTYVTSIETNKIHWKTTESWIVGTIWNPRESGFRLYLNKAKSLKLLESSKWRVNYIGYEGNVDCKMSRWSSWYVSVWRRAQRAGAAAYCGAETQRVGQCPSQLKQQKYCFKICDATTNSGSNSTLGFDPFNSTLTQLVTLSITVSGGRHRRAESRLDAGHGPCAWSATAARTARWARRCHRCLLVAHCDCGCA